jgi:tetratricopeptide (TPR) repeat protein
MWITACALALAATVAPRAEAPSPDSSRYGSLEALRHYAAGRLLEERGTSSEAAGEIMRALAADPRSTGLLQSASEISVRAGEPLRALEFADRALALDPTDARTRWLRGAALFHLERYPESVAELERAADAEPGQMDYQRTLARAAEEVQRWDLVARAWRRVIDSGEDDDPEGWFQLGTAEARLGHMGAADSALAIAEDANPDRPGLDYVRGLVDASLGHDARAIDRFSRHLEQHPDDIDTRRRLVELLARSRRWKEAYPLARAVTRTTPGDVVALDVEADLAFRAGAPAEGRAALDRLMGTAPDDPGPVLRSVSILARNARAADGVALAERWVKRHPEDPRCEDLLARSCAVARRWDAAEAHALRSLAAAPDSLERRLLLGRIRQSAGRFSAAESTWRELLRGHPERTDARLELAFCLERRDDVPGAEAAARDVITAEPDNAVALNFLGYLFADRGIKLDEALELIGRAIDLDPGNGSYIDSLGWIYFRLGRLDQARAQLERAVPLTEGDAEVHEHLGDVYKSLRLNDMARTQYRLALASDPANSRVKAKLTELR